MTILMIYGNINFQWNVPISSGYPDGDWLRMSCMRLTTNSFKTPIYIVESTWRGEVKSSGCLTKLYSIDGPTKYMQSTANT